MLICKNVPLRKFNTFSLDYMADCMIRIKTDREAENLFNGTIGFEKPLMILGGGSNILFTGDFHGTIIYPEIGGITIEEQSTDHVIISAGAGIYWDKLVEWCVEKGFGGMENLSLIPGLVGAVPVQNIGAYGSEVKNIIEKVKAISTINGSIKVFKSEECGFAYRDSIFKNREKGKYLVTRVYFKLKTRPELNTGYGSLEDEIKKIGERTLKNIRLAVINLRRSKLPDPAITGNAGSFFKNPVINNSLAEKLKKVYPGLPVYFESPGYTKLAAGWLIEQCGWKGKRKGNAGVHEKQALVIVNHGNATGKEILELSEEIRKSVNEKFGIGLEREVEVV